MLRPFASYAQADESLSDDYKIIDSEEGPFTVEQYVLEGVALQIEERAYVADFITLSVPENRERQDSRTIELPIIRIRATGPEPAEPVFWFEGGPGQSNMDTFDFDYFIERHDHVMVGYRGVDGSVSLECPEVVALLKEAKDVLTDETLERLGGAFVDCSSRLSAAKIDIDGYTIVEVVNDMESARKALGYEQINLVAESFGTRMAYLYGVMYPDAIRRSVMIGANPPGAMVWEPEQMDALVEHYGTLWANDPGTSQDLVEAIREVNHDMPRHWLFMPIHSGSVKASAFAMLFERSSAAMVFDTYMAASNGDPSGLWLISMVAPYIFPEIVNWGDNASKAVSADYDPTRDYARELMPEHAIMGAPLGRFLWGPGGRWPIKPIPDEYRRLQSSDVETLILSGNVDLSTPSENATRDLLPNLVNGRQIVLSEMGHIGDLWTLQPEATHRIVTSFLETGIPDTTTVQYVPMDFEVKWGYPLLAKLLLAGIVLIVLIIGVGIWFVIRLFRRRKSRINTSLT